MTEGAGSTAVERAREAAARGEWKECFDLLMSADADGLLGPADLPFLGEVSYAAGHLDVTIETWERAYAACIQGGDNLAAAGAAVRLAMHLLFDTALMAPVRGWLARAERLLDADGETPPHAWFAVVRTYERMLTGDIAGARQWARRAIDIGAQCDPAACAIGRVAEARLLILEGDVKQGLALLDEAGVATMSGELDPLSTGVVFCELVCALQGLALYDVAEEWTDAMERWCETNAIGSLHGRCRVHRAEILRLRGDCDEAERQALMAVDELRVYLRRELGWPLSELGRIRFHKADLVGAEQSLLAAHAAGWDPQPGLALVRLAQGDAATAVASIRDALEHPLRVPFKERPPNNDLQRAPLLEAQVEIEIAGGDVGRARAAADALGVIASQFVSSALLGSAALARGRVELAEGDSAGAELSLSEAVRLWNDVGAPYETAMARRSLADAQSANGREHQAGLERQAARTSLDAMGTSAPPPVPVQVADAGAPNVFRQEGDVWLVVFDGATARVRNLKGMRYLARLLAAPGREFHVLDLVAAEAGSSAIDLGDAGQVLDDRAKASYRRRLAEIDEDIEVATANGDAERAAQADAERDFLVRELSRAVGLGGRDRRAGGASERARVAVTRALRQAMARIADHHPQIGEHLDYAVRTGSYCAYEPDPDANSVERVSSGGVIIECAINGATSKATNPNVPIEPAEIASDALACFDAGAAIVHNHIDRFRVTEAESAERYLEGWLPILAARPDALLYPTVHFGATIGYEHLIPLAEAGLRLGLVDPGSVNLGGTDSDGVPRGGFVYANSFDAIARAFDICREHELGPSIAIYEPGFLRTALAWWRAGRLPRGAMFKLYFSTERGYLGAPFGLPPTPTALDAYLELLDGCDVPWAVSVVGGDVVASAIAGIALDRGGHLHLGLEFFGGDRTTTNAELVAEAVALCESVGRAVATPDEAAQILGLPK